MLPIALLALMLAQAAPPPPNQGQPPKNCRQLCAPQRTRCLDRCRSGPSGKQRAEGNCQLMCKMGEETCLRNCDEYMGGAFGDPQKPKQP